MAIQRIKRVDDEALWANDVAQELSTLKGSLSDKSKTEQSEFLEEELEYLLGEVGAQSGELRKKLLKALNQQTQEFSYLFSDELVEDERSYDVSSDPVGQIEELWRQSSLGQRDEIMERLGLVTSSQDQIDQQELKRIEVFETDFTLPITESDWESYRESYEGFCGALDVKQGSEISFVELLKLCSEMVSILSVVDDYLVKYWDQVVTRESRNEYDIERNGPLSVRFIESLSGNGVVSFKKDLDQIRDSKPKNMDTLLWGKYTQIAKYITAESVDDEFQKITGKLLVKYLKSKK